MVSVRLSGLAFQRLLTVLPSLLACVIAGCDGESVTVPGTGVPLAIRAALDPAASVGVMSAIDRVRVEVVRPPNEVIAEGEAALSPGQQSVSMDLWVTLTKSPEELLVRAELWDANILALAGEEPMLAYAGRANASPTIGLKLVAPVLEVSPRNLSFAAATGSNASQQFVTVRNRGGKVLSWSAIADQAWLLIPSVSGTLNPNDSTTLAVSATADTLSTGTYSGAVSFSGIESLDSPQTVRVGFEVGAAPSIRVTPTVLSFSTVVGSNPTPRTQTFTVTNSGGGTLNWTASENATWLTVSPTGGSLAAGDSASVTAEVTSQTLSASSYSAPITVSGSGAAARTVTVDLQVGAGPSIRVTPTVLSFSTVVGSNPTPRTQTFTVTNSGGGTLNWTASENATWLTVSPTGGSLAAGDSASVTAEVTSQTLSASSYSAPITVSGSGAAARTVTVDLTVSQPGRLEVVQDTLWFSAQEGVAPFQQSQNFRIRNTGGTLFTYTLAAPPLWLSLGRTSGSLAPNDGIGIDATVNTSTLTEGLYSGTITVRAAGATGSPTSIIVLLDITAPSGSIVGRIFIDRNSNDVFDGTDQGLPNVGLVLQDSIGGARTTLSGAAGDYSFGFLRTGNYTLDVDTLRFPSTLRYGGRGSLPVTVSVVAGANRVDFPFDVVGTAPSISNLLVRLDLLNDRTCPNSGSRFEATFDYADPDGDVPTTARIFNTMRFSNGRIQRVTWPGPRTYSVSGRGFNGAVRASFCTLFGNAGEVVDSFSLEDGAGNRSNVLQFGRPRPPGAN